MPKTFVINPFGGVYADDVNIDGINDRFVNVWVRASSSSACNFLSYGSTYRWTVGSSADGTFFTHSGYSKDGGWENQQTAVGVNDGQWHMLTYVGGLDWSAYMYGEGTDPSWQTAVYVDGVRVASGSFYGGPQNDLWKIAGSVRMGEKNSAPFDLAYAEIGNKKLTDADVLTKYNATKDQTRFQP